MDSLCSPSSAVYSVSVNTSYKIKNRKVSRPPAENQQLAKQASGGGGLVPEPKLEDQEESAGSKITLLILFAL